jgi:serine/threonine protein phosphatase PrpC
MDWSIAGASIQGISHVKHDIVCQDAIASHRKDTFYGIALSDGAGSLKYSDIGAQLITKISLRYVEHNYDAIYDGTINQSEMVDKIENYLMKKALKLKIKFEELGSTLQLVCIKDDKLIFIHIGDGVISYVNKSGLVEVLSHPMNGEFSNQTFFTTTKYENRLRLGIGEIKDAQSFILMSDGMSDSFYINKIKQMHKSTSRFAKFLHIHGVQEAKKFYLSVIKEYIMNRTGDDISLIVIDRNKVHSNEIVTKSTNEVSQQVDKIVNFKDNRIIKRIVFYILGVKNEWIKKRMLH